MWMGHNPRCRLVFGRYNSTNETSEVRFRVVFIKWKTKNRACRWKNRTFSWLNLPETTHLHLEHLIFSFIKSVYLRAYSALSIPIQPIFSFKPWYILLNCSIKWIITILSHNMLHRSKKMWIEEIFMEENYKYRNPLTVWELSRHLICFKI